ncbi:carboxylesterase family protein [Apiospora phragmitis]|uniref:Carboxylic ester hydrolase n=1 Tax=Apiospora phragmitis TaxID=2905665 RepID=A0ABR1TRS8_9PEZI
MLASLAVQTLLVAAAAASPLVSKAGNDDDVPRVTIKNSTLVGVYSPGYDQDFFLGVPFSQLRIGDLRFRNPQPINESWDGERAAQKLPPACVGYGDCLYLNVVRPARASPAEPLPVLVWTYGGGFIQGSAADLRNNISFIADRSAELGQPIIGVTMNYRLSAWGFLASREVADGGDSNFGLRDQRMSLEWIRDNIAAFGGDPAKVTIWGQSAGCQGDGSAVGSSLRCLRALPFEKLNAVVNSSATLRTWGPLVDGDLIARSSHQQYLDGSYLRIPIIAGDNTAEGTAFAPKGINTTEQFRDDAYARKLLDAYPARSPDDCLPNLAPDYVPPAYPYGSQFRRVATA